MGKLKKILEDAKEFGFTLSAEDYETLSQAIDKAEQFDKIVHCTDPCKYYYPPVCTFHKWLPMVSRKGFCYHGIKGKYSGKTPVVNNFDDVVNTETHIEFCKYMNPPQEAEDDS